MFRQTANLTNPPDKWSNVRNTFIFSFTRSLGEISMPHSNNNKENDHMASISFNSTAAFDRKREEEKKDAERKRSDDKIKAAKKLVKERMELRQGVFNYKKSTEGHNEQTFASKISRLNDLNPEALVGEYLAIFTIQFFQAMFQTQYWIQQRAYSEAMDIDAHYEKSFKNQCEASRPTNVEQPSDHGIRVAYQPIREWNPATQEFEYKLAMNGDLVYPAVYELDAAGNVDYHSVPNTNGLASRAAIRANGFVPIENYKESVEIQLLKFRQEFVGSAGMTPDQKRMLNLHIQEAQSNGEKDVEDNSVIAAQRAAAAEKAAALRRTPSHS